MGTDMIDQSIAYLLTKAINCRPVCLEQQSLRYRELTLDDLRPETGIEKERKHTLMTRGG
jgi:hypothetical protein